MQAPVVRQYDERAGAKEVLIPDAKQTHQYGQVACERRGAEVFVDVMTARQHLLECSESERQRNRQPDGGP